jgi:hypothetical protein
MSGFHRRRTAAATALLILFVLAAATCLLAAARPVDDDGSSRSMQQQRAPATRLFDYLPRPRVIPRSGPSEGHNSIGQTMEEAGEADGRRP